MKMEGEAQSASERRTYRLGARAVAAEATAARIVDAFIAALTTRPYDDISLDEIASTAGVTRQTVMRRFESKSGLLRAGGEEIGRRVDQERSEATGDRPGGAVARLVADYERTGALIVNLLMQEMRSPQLHEALEIGRAGHRGWIERVFGPRLHGLVPPLREMRLTELVLVTDVWMWHMLRVDQQRSVEATVRILEDLVLQLLPPITAFAANGEPR